MKLIQAFKMAFKSIFSNKGRMVLTMLGIIIGITSVIVMVSVVQGSNQQIRDYYESMGTNKINVYAYQWNGKDISEKLYNYCLGLKDLVLGVTPNGNVWSRNGIKYRTMSTQNMEQGQTQIWLGSDQYSICNNYVLAKGRDIAWLDVKKYNQVVVLGSKTAEYLFQYKDPIGETVTIGGYPFTVIGVYAAKGSGDTTAQYGYDMYGYMNNIAVVPYTMGRLLNKSESIESFTVKAASKEATTEAITKLDGFLSGIIDTNYGYYSVYSENEWIESSNEQNRMMSLVLGGIAGISLLVGGIGIMNIMLVTVSERTREIGIRKAIGGSRRSIILQFLIEASVICAMGGIIGLALGYVGTLIAGKLILNMMLLPGVPLSFGAVGFSVILGMIFGLYPAIKASGLQPVEALRAD
ncbi:MAG: FtsX-like permease family protein [Papillibacter sp.]|jgi:putative ABC transport system permease protein|nr:FtsX-like permease family protein [Papillibacter sp.]